MLLTKEVKMKWCRRYKQKYIDLGYKFTKIGDEFYVKVEDLTDGSSAFVDVKCDVCGDIIKRRYPNYLRYHDDIFGDVCSHCKTIKIKNTCIEKYGVTNPSYIDDVVQKRKATCIDKYGVESVFQLEEFKNNIKDIMIDRYGVDNPSKSKEVKTKKVQTCLEHYGVEHPNQSCEIQQKCIDTCLKNYGVKYPMQSNIVRKKSTESMYKNGSCRTSKIQNELYNMLKQIYPICELNYPLKSYSLDIFIESKNQKIDIEFDGEYWHRFKKESDNKRDNICYTNGYKVLRIKGNQELPNKQTLIDSINELINQDISYKEIYTDWNYKYD